MSVAWRACPRPAAWSAVPAGVDFGDGEAEFLELGDQFAEPAVVVEPGAVVGELVVGQDPGSGLAVFLAGPLVVGAVPLRGVGVAAAAAVSAAAIRSARVPGRAKPRPSPPSRTAVTLARVLASPCVTAAWWGHLRPAAVTTRRSCPSAYAATGRRPRRRRRRCR